MRQSGLGGFNGVGIGNIHPLREGQRPECTGGAAQGLGIDIPQDHPRAARDTAFGHCIADAACTAGDQDNSRGAHASDSVSKRCAKA